mgnify:CR=1 FL=1
MIECVCVCEFLKIHTRTHTPDACGYRVWFKGGFVLVAGGCYDKGRTTGWSRPGRVGCGVARPSNWRRWMHVVGFSGLRPQRWWWWWIWVVLLVAGPSWSCNRRAEWDATHSQREKGAPLLPGSWWGWICCVRRHVLPCIFPPPPSALAHHLLCLLLLLLVEVTAVVPIPGCSFLQGDFQGAETQQEIRKVIEERTGRVPATADVVLR